MNENPRKLLEHVILRISSGKDTQFLNETTLRDGIAAVVRGSLFGHGMAAVLLFDCFRGSNWYGWRFSPELALREEEKSPECAEDLDWKQNDE